MLMNLALGQSIDCELKGGYRSFPKLKGYEIYAIINFPGY
jgi:hypothetical protein